MLHTLHGAHDPTEVHLKIASCWSDSHHDLQEALGGQHTKGSPISDMVRTSIYKHKKWQWAVPSLQQSTWSSSRSSNRRWHWPEPGCGRDMLVTLFFHRKTEEFLHHLKEQADYQVCRGAGEDEAFHILNMLLRRREDGGLDIFVHK